MKWFWNKKEKEDSYTKDSVDYDNMQEELVELKDKVARMEREAKVKEHDSHIVDCLNTYEYATKRNHNVEVNKMDNGAVEIIYHTVNYYAFCCDYTPDIKIELSKDEAYLIGEFLHECNNKS